MSETVNSPVIIEQQGALRLIRINRPKALNALDPALIKALHAAFMEAFGDESVTTIWLESTDARAFCAGGDVKALYQAASNKAVSEQRTIGLEYFAAEYQLDACLEHSPKPLVIWGRGLVMGGGWGLFGGGDLKLIDASARFAMPELQIGLFPDVGAAHFLQRRDWRAGTLIGCSGIHLTTDDVLALGYADACLDPEDADALKQWLASGNEVAQWSVPVLSPGAIERREHWQAALASLPEPNLSDWIEHIERSDFEPFRAASKQWQTGSSLSVALTWHHFRKLCSASRVEALNEDLRVASHAVGEHEFLEGVRALLIDKDKAPLWLYPHVASVPFSLIERFYRPLPEAPTISADPLTVIAAGA